MTLQEFQRIPLLRSFIAADPEDGSMKRHEVRRDPATGLTLSLAFPLTTTGESTHEHTQQAGDAEAR